MNGASRGGESEADELIEGLGLEPHPEGGWFRSTWRAPAPAGDRPVGSAIYYLLKAGERSLRHRIDAAEIWHHYLGGPVELLVHPGTEHEVRTMLGAPVATGGCPQAAVPAGAWQEARTVGGFALLGCTVAPAFMKEHWELHEGSSEEL